MTFIDPIYMKIIRKIDLSYWNASLFTLY